MPLSIVVCAFTMPYLDSCVDLLYRCAFTKYGNVAEHSLAFAGSDDPKHLADLVSDIATRVLDMRWKDDDGTRRASKTSPPHQKR
ncbi:hypothetical protein NXC14_PC00670 (plasmid) [Rhizobium sp. NXC14]|nr:hypothetical protein NXC14_PC00670 [Rhizobium sp. NXC14]